MRYTDWDSISNDSTTVQMSYRSLYSEQVHGPGIDLSRSGKVWGEGVCSGAALCQSYVPPTCHAGWSHCSQYIR